LTGSQGFTVENPAWGDASQTIGVRVLSRPMGSGQNTMPCGSVSSSKSRGVSVWPSSSPCQRQIEPSKASSSDPACLASVADVVAVLGPAAGMADDVVVGKRPHRPAVRRALEEALDPVAEEGGE
jgi:hypothetical protein